MTLAELHQVLADGERSLAAAASDTRDLPEAARLDLAAARIRLKSALGHIEAVAAYRRTSHRRSA